MTVKRTHTGWAVDFYPDGRAGPRVRRSGFASKAEALKFERDSGVRAVSSSPRYTLAALVDIWYQCHGHTLKDARYRLARMKAVCERLGSPYFDHFTAADWASYRHRRLESVSVETVNHEQRYLSSMFNELVRLGIVQGNPIGSIRRLRRDPVELTFLTLEQCAQLLDECQSSTNQHAYPVALLCLATGARWGEAESLARSAVFGAKVHFHNTKNGKPRSVPIPGHLEAFLLSAGHPGTGRLFSSCRSAFRAAYERCGFQTPGQLTHILRHTFASHYMMAGGDLLALQRILGHGSITMTMRYAHLSPDHLVSAVTLSPFAQLGKVVNL